MYKSIFLVILIALFSCTEDVKEDSTGQRLSDEELEFIAKFDHQLLNQMARKTVSEQHKSVENADEVEPIESKEVKPVVYDQLLSTKHMEKAHQKEVFIAQMLPQILITKFHMNQQRKILELLLHEDSLKNVDYEKKQAFIRQQQKKHNAENAGELIDKLTTLPTSLILAQAAVESQWGSSRSYWEANNPFQIISHDSTEARLKTFDKDRDIIYLKNYKNLPYAIIDYFRNINRAEDLTELRKQKNRTDDPMELVRYMDSYIPKYSGQYVKLLSQVIQENDLTRYDNYKIDSSYINILTKNEIQTIIDEQNKRDKNIVSSDARRIKKIISKNVDIQYKALSSPEDIVEVTSKYVVPNVYTNVIDLKYLLLEKRKDKFIDMLLPSVLTASYGIKQTRQRISAIQEKKAENQPISREDSAFLQKQLKAWNADDIEQLLTKKLITRPNSIMMAQAAVETGWGSSRFFVAANNTFGVWSFNPNESRIKALGTREGKPIYVRKYDNLSASIIDYYKVIAKGPYDEYREARKRTDDPYVLVEYLFRYSEMGQEYIDRLKTVMRKSRLTRYDEYQIDPAYIEVE
ncbi:MAG: glucosaminidase domain-containing protein [Bacteroidales bacterium]